MSIVINANQHQSWNWIKRANSILVNSFPDFHNSIILSPKTTIWYEQQSLQNSEFSINGTTFNLARIFTPDYYFWIKQERGYGEIWFPVEIVRKERTQKPAQPYRITTDWYFEWGEIVGKNIHIYMTKARDYMLNIGYSIQVGLVHSNWSFDIIYEDNGTINNFKELRKIATTNGMIAQAGDRPFFQFNFDILQWSNTWDALHWFGFWSLWSLTEEDKRLKWVQISVD